MRFARRLAGLVIVMAVAACQPQAGVGEFERGARERWALAAPKPPEADSFRATVCAAGPCVLVEAGGLAFLVGAGAGSAEGLAARGLFRADLDGILLSDLSLASAEGLPAIQQAAFTRGRSDPMPVYGPEGVLTAVDGANLMLSAAGGEGSRLQVGAEGEDQGLEGKVVFDSGVVSIRAFPSTGARGRVYRFDFSGKSLIIAGCGARAGDVVAAVRGARVGAVVAAVQSERLLRVEREAARAARAADVSAAACMAVEDAVKAANEARLAAGLIAPLAPAVNGSAGRRAWREVLPPGALEVGEPGAALDLTGEKPLIIPPK